jgi:hypothetical protein
MFSPGNGWGDDMKRLLAIMLGIAAAMVATSGTLLAQSMRGAPFLFHRGSPDLYPDPSLTPGEADTFSAAAIQKRYKCPASAKKKKGTKKGSKKGAKKGTKSATCTYSKAHRNVPSSVKNAVYAAYDRLHPGLNAYCHALDKPKAQRRKFTTGKGQRCEVDHFCPVGIGCANSAANLWIQRADTTLNGQPMGFHQKDDLEAWGIAQVKAGNLTPEEFDRRIWGDWVAYYLEVRPAHSNISN